MRYLSLVMYPLVLGYSMYSLAYEPHKSWCAHEIPSLTLARLGIFIFFPSCELATLTFALTLGSRLQVLVGAWLDRRLRIHVRLHHDDAAALH